jgi:hypothetical protein
VPSFYIRRLVENNLKIESICSICGFMIVKSVANGLGEAEREHRWHCHHAAGQPEREGGNQVLLTRSHTP